MPQERSIFDTNIGVIPPIELRNGVFQEDTIECQNALRKGELSARCGSKMDFTVLTDVCLLMSGYNC
jgi:hypothetical protein